MKKKKIQRKISDLINLQSRIDVVSYRMNMAMRQFQDMQDLASMKELESTMVQDMQTILELEAAVERI